MTSPYHGHFSVSTAELAARLGLKRFGHEWRGACPACEYAASLIVTERGGKALWHCVSCADQRAVTAAIRAAIGGLPASAAPERLPRAAPDPAARRARAEAIWRGGERITPDCAAGRYLERRGIAAVASSPALRWRRDCPHPGGGRRIALIAAIAGPDGNLQGVQRIYLDRDGRKADCEPVKASLGLVAGGAVRLQPASVKLVIAEGVESAASAGVLLGMPAWSAISAGNLARNVALPAGILSVTIAADHDGPGLRAAEAALRRWRAEGRTVRIVKAAVFGRDFNDLATDRAAGGDQ